MIVACLLDPSIKAVDLDLIDRLVPECGRENSDQVRPRVFKEHTPKFPLFSRVLYNYRDGRDCTVSAFRYAQDALGYNGSMLEFLVDRKAQVFGLWHEHIEQALSFRAKYPDRIHMIGYESLRHDAEAETDRVAHFLKIRVGSDRIDEIVRLTSLERQKTQRAYDDPRKKHTLQTGKVGGWREVLTDDQVRIFEGLSSRALTALGYELTTSWPARKADVSPG